MTAATVRPFQAGEGGGWQPGPALFGCAFEV